MDATHLTLLSSSVLTAFGDYRYAKLSLEQAKQLIAEFQSEQKPIQSAIGHQPTAEFLSSLLDYPIQKNRIEFKQSKNDIGIVFKPNGRAPEGAVLSCQELEALGYEFGLLIRLS
ncbi:MAG TPA: DUF1874 domain-containing protein [Blastocatellia bacterium]|nr:DUF1874 domain-containing protein [Blastocatellia bacterium]